MLVFEYTVTLHFDVPCLSVSVGVMKRIINRIPSRLPAPSFFFLVLCSSEKKNIKYIIYLPTSRAMFDPKTFWRAFVRNCFPPNSSYRPPELQGVVQKENVRRCKGKEKLSY